MGTKKLATTQWSQALFRLMWRFPLRGRRIATRLTLALSLTRPSRYSGVATCLNLGRCSCVPLGKASQRLAYVKIATETEPLRIFARAEAYTIPFVESLRNSFLGAGFHDYSMRPAYSLGYREHCRFHPEQRSLRLRLLPPCREHLAQACALVYADRPTD